MHRTPSAVRSGNAGEIISEVLNGGYEVSAMQMIHFNRAEAAELFEVYKGVLPYYSEILDEMTIEIKDMEVRRKVSLSV